MKTSSQAINTTQAFMSGSDMSGREQEILKKIIKDTGFIANKLIWRSNYWGTEKVGAVHYLGKYQGKDSVLKIQGVKPDISELFMIREFSKQNKSKIIRPPHIFHAIPWKDDHGYEAFIMEFVSGEKVLQSGQMQSDENIKKFFSYYQEYRDNCIPLKPWIPCPRLEKDGITQLIQLSQKAYPNHPHRDVLDFDLVVEASKIVQKNYLHIPLEFMHGHFSAEDLIYQGRDVVLFSNLFWKWRYPFYDAAFAYHWCIYGLAKVADITPEKIEEQRSLWLSNMFSLPWVKNSLQNLRLAKNTLLERCIAGLMIDCFLVPHANPVAKYLVRSTREQLRLLMGELSNG